ncbi:hypothetical protein [Opitutus sp. GAS368]|uniref:hypothetical protein n=1 Tax=Opitutus sp. GAS368 TaxID=1882749 RepID=UPI000B856D0B|nr:hypothetical protein [Opitutus sp. GAS368]
MNPRSITRWLANLFFITFIAQVLWSGLQSGRDGVAMVFNLAAAVYYLWMMNTSAVDRRWQKFVALGPLLWVGVQVLVFSQRLNTRASIGSGEPAVRVFAASEIPLFLAGVFFVVLYWCFAGEPNHPTEPLSPSRGGSS